jgi:multisubunit Na+/H+ antiporter MnhF subunit
MQSLLRDFLLSYCPSWVRRNWRPGSQLTSLRASTWSGLAQFLLAAAALIVRFKVYFVVRGHQLTARIAGSNETGQAIIAVIVALEFLLHPLSLFLSYLAIEGFIRFVGGIVTGEIVPSLLVSLYFKTADSVSESWRRRHSAAPIADAFDRLPGSRIRIASSTSKAGWNASITIGIGGQWFEVEREEHGGSPRPFVYILRPAPPGKILRGYEEYDATALSASRITTQSKNLS